MGQYGAELDRRATGRFFRPLDLLERHAISLKKSNYDGPAYYGEYPLAFAACIGNPEIYDYLIDESYKSRPGQGRADPNAQDSFGNTVIHMTIIKNQKVMCSVNCRFLVLVILFVFFIKFCLTTPPYYVKFL